MFEQLASNVRSKPRFWKRVVSIAALLFFVMLPISISVPNPEPSPAVDSDGDGIPDDWEERYHGAPCFLNRNNPADAWLDCDNDGARNFDEYTFGTNPTRKNTDRDSDQDGKIRLDDDVGIAYQPKYNIDQGLDSTLGKNVLYGLLYPTLNFAVSYRVIIQDDGSFDIEVIKVTRTGPGQPTIDVMKKIKIGSQFYWPNEGRDNPRNGFGEHLTGEEPAWHVTITRAPGDVNAITIVGEGSSYRIKRKIKRARYFKLDSGRKYLFENKIIVEDTFKNITNEGGGPGQDVTIPFYTDLFVRGAGSSNFQTHFMGGLEGRRNALNFYEHPNPTVFAVFQSADESVFPDFGVGVLLKDFVFRVQSDAVTEPTVGDVRSLRIENNYFGLGPGDEYKMEWWIYPLASQNYYDFINVVREDNIIRDGGTTRKTAVNGVGIENNLFLGESNPNDWLHMANDPFPGNDLEEFFKQTYTKHATIQPQSYKKASDLSQIAYGPDLWRNLDAGSSDFINSDFLDKTLGNNRFDFRNDVVRHFYFDLFLSSEDNASTSYSDSRITGSTYEHLRYGNGLGFTYAFIPKLGGEWGNALDNFIASDPPGIVSFLDQHVATCHFGGCYNLRGVYLGDSLPRISAFTYGTNVADDSVWDSRSFLVTKNPFHKVKKIGSTYLLSKDYRDDFVKRIYTALHSDVVEVHPLIWANHSPFANEPLPPVIPSTLFPIKPALYLTEVGSLLQAPDIKRTHLSTPLTFYSTDNANINDTRFFHVSLDYGALRYPFNHVEVPVSGLYEDIYKIRGGGGEEYLFRASALYPGTVFKTPRWPCTNCFDPGILITNRSGLVGWCQSGLGIDSIAYYDFSGIKTVSPPWVRAVSDKGCALVKINSNPTDPAQSHWNDGIVVVLTKSITPQVSHICTSGPPGDSRCLLGGGISQPYNPDCQTCSCIAAGRGVIKNKPVGTLCPENSDNICSNGIKECDGEGVCRSSITPADICDDYDSCTTDECVSATDGDPCRNVFNPALPGCGWCTRDDQCPSHPTNVCKTPKCINHQCGFANATNGTGCGNVDNNQCTIDQCFNGVCTAAQGGNTTCTPDTNPCTDDPACDPVSGCTHPNIANGTSCDNDGTDKCHQGDTCQEGVCTDGTQVVTCTPDTNPCTDDPACDPVSGCTHPIVEGRSCAEGNQCKTGKTCNAQGQCSGGTDITCAPDTNSCTDDLPCDPTQGCIHRIVVGRDCSGGDQCKTGEKCDASGQCSGGTAVPCNDNDVCTTDSCNPASGCVFTAIPDCCTSDTQCDDGNQCTTDTCNLTTHTCTHPVTPCNDNDPCTADTCDSATGCVFTRDNTLPGCAVFFGGTTLVGIPPGGLLVGAEEGQSSLAGEAAPEVGRGWPNMWYYGPNYEITPAKKIFGQVIDWSFSGPSATLISMGGKFMPRTFKSKTVAVGKSEVGTFQKTVPTRMETTAPQKSQRKESFWSSLRKHIHKIIPIF